MRFKPINDLVEHCEICMSKEKMSESGCPDYNQAQKNLAPNCERHDAYYAIYLHTFKTRDEILELIEDRKRKRNDNINLSCK